MEYFTNLISAIGFRPCTSSKLDLITNLPLEVSQQIFRLLDARTLMNVMMVSRKWYRICKSDHRLRKSVRIYIQGRKRKMTQLSRYPINPRRIRQKDNSSSSRCDKKPLLFDIRHITGRSQESNLNPHAILQTPNNHSSYRQAKLPKRPKTLR